MLPSVLLAMPIFINRDRYSIKEVIRYLRVEWKLNVEGDDVDDDTAVFSIH